MNWSYWSRAFTSLLYQIFSSRERRRRKMKREDEHSLGEIIEFLTENPGKMFILADKTAAMFYYPPEDHVIIIDGDFDGDPQWCNFMLHKRLWEMELMD